MSYGYCTVDGTGDCLPRLTGVEVAIALSAVARADCFDDTPPPEVPVFSFDDDDDWPLCVALTDSDRAWFAFRSSDPTRIPYTKLSDNSPWIIDPEECRLLLTAVNDVITGRQTRTVDRWVIERLAARGLEGDAVGGEIERCLQALADIASAGEGAGGFWSY